MAVIQPVQASAPAERTQNVGANPLEEARATASAQARKGQASALHPDPAEPERQSARTLTFRHATSPTVAGTPAESGGKGAIISIVV